MGFVVPFNQEVLVACAYYQKHVCQKRKQDLGGKTVRAITKSEDSDNDAELLTFSVHGIK